MQITLDNNIIPKIRGLASEAVKKQLISLIRNYKIILHLNEVHLIELLKLRKEFGIFKSHCETVVELFNGGILKAFSLLISDELSGNGVVKFHENILKCRIFQMLFDITRVKSLPENFDNNIENILAGFCAYNDNFISGEESRLRDCLSDLKKAKEGGRFTNEEIDDFKRQGFEHYYKLKSQEKISSAMHFCKNNKISIAENRIKCAIDSNEFPYLNTFLRSRYAMHYKYFCNYQREFDKNDIVDNRYLINSIMLDYLVSDDEGFINMAKIACPRLLKIIK